MKIKKIYIILFIFILFFLLLIVWYNLGNSIKFNIIQKFNLWSSKESVSGKGSEIKNTKVIRKILPEIIQKYDIKIMLDCPCGDMNYMSDILKNNNFKIKYIGMDIVYDLIQENKKKYPQYTFICSDIINQKLPKYDLIVMKDLLNHLSSNDIIKVLLNIKNSKSKYLLLNNNNIKKNRKNYLTPAPFWVNINWKLSPWNLNVIEEFFSDGRDKNYVLVKI